MRHRALGFFVMLSVALCSCDNADRYPPDPCLVLNDASSGPTYVGKGLVRVRNGQFTHEMDQIWVGPTPGDSGVGINGCYRDDTEDWGILSQWTFFDPSLLPVEIEHINNSQDETKTSLAGYLEICSEHYDECRLVYDSWYAFGGAYEASGEFTAYDPVEGHFAGWAKWVTHGNIQIEIDVDVTWDPNDPLSP